MTWFTALLIPLLTIALSGVVSSFVTYHLTSSRAERDFRLKKLEEVLIALARFISGYSGFMDTTLAVSLVTGEVPVIEKAKEDVQSQAKRDREQVEMTIKIYFPRLVGPYERFHSKWEETGGHYGEALIEAKKGKSTTHGISHHWGLVRQVGEAAADLRTAAFTEARILQSTLGSGAIAFVREQMGG